MNRILSLAALLPALLLSTQLSARAEENPAEDGKICQQRLDETKAQWQASPIPTSKARAMNVGTGRNHDHSAMVTNYMQGQIAKAETLCRAGKEHDALLHVDVVRAWLQLPFEEHPAQHGYHPGNGPH